MRAAFADLLNFHRLLSVLCMLMNIDCVPLYFEVGPIYKTLYSCWYVPLGGLTKLFSSYGVCNIEDVGACILGEVAFSLLPLAAGDVTEVDNTRSGGKA